MKRLIALTLLAAVTALPACRETPSPLVVGTGTLEPSSVECSAWFVHADSGHLYQLTSLATEFEQHGLRVRFTLSKRGDLASTCMVGEIADLVSITKL